MKNILVVFVSLAVFCCYGIDIYVLNENEKLSIAKDVFGIELQKTEFVAIKSAVPNHYFFVFTPENEDICQQIVIFKNSIDEKNLIGRVSGLYDPDDKKISGFFHYVPLSSRDKRLVQNGDSEIMTEFNSYIDTLMFFNEPNQFAPKNPDGSVCRAELVSMKDQGTVYSRFLPNNHTVKKIFPRQKNTGTENILSALKLPDAVAKSMEAFRQRQKKTPLFPHCEKMENGYRIAYKENITYFIVEDGDKIYISVSFKNVPFLLFCCDGSSFRAHYCDESGSTRIEIAPDPLLVHAVFHLRDEKPVHISYKDAFDSEELFEIKQAE